MIDIRSRHGSVASSSAWPVSGSQPPVSWVCCTGLCQSLTGLARAYRKLVLAERETPERLVADAITQHPVWVSGSRRGEAHLLRSLPGSGGKWRRGLLRAGPARRTAARWL